MKRKIYYYGHPCLRKKSHAVEKITPEIKQICQDMLDTVHFHKSSIGLAAIQLDINYRIFIVRYFTRDEKGEVILQEPTLFVNPKLSHPSKGTNIDREGCMSFPEVYESVERPNSVTIEAMDMEGKSFKQELTGYSARQVMHENDHLNGVLFIDRVSKKRKKELEPLLRKLKILYKTHNAS
ncbi:MAG: Peptide deformylase [Chlamydiae bacterium]|nr:Peptide deformylase [Chlamydiota bacterium]